jgi:hypothetical protein
MANLQLSHLTRSRLDALGAEELYLRLEPMLLKRKRLRQMEAGDRIDLGTEAPKLELARDGCRLASAFPTARGVLIGEAGEEFPREGERHTVLEARLSQLPGPLPAPGTELPLPWPMLERLYLYAEGRYVATAVLVRHEGGYALELLEVTDG